MRQPSHRRPPVLFCRVLLALLFVAVGFAQANDTATKNLHEIPLQVTGVGPWYRMALPMSVRFAAAYADLRDIRVLNGEGEMLPFGLLHSTERQALNNETIQARVFPLYLAERAKGFSDVRIDVNAAGQVIAVTAPQSTTATSVKLRGWLLDLGDRHERLHQMKLDAAQIPEGFQRFTIESSVDLQHWIRWTDGQWVNLSFDGEQIKQNVIALSGGHARYLRLLWQQPTEAPMLTAASVVARLTQTQEAALTWSEPLLTPEKPDENSHIWALPLALPLERVRVDSLPDNTVAPVDISGRVYPQPYADNVQYRRRLSQWRAMVLHGHRPRAPAQTEPHWQLLARGVLSRVPVNGADTLQNEVILPGLPVQQLRIQWDMRGTGLGAATPVLHVAMTEIQLVFLSRGSPPYRLQVGDVDAKHANLPLDTLIPGFAGDATLHTMGQAVATTDTLGESVNAPAAAATEGDGKKWVLWGILLVGVGLLGAMVWQLLRKPA